MAHLRDPQQKGVMDAGFYNMDCMDALRTFPDKFFDLAIVDPPYGDGQGGSGADRFGGMLRASIDGTATRNTPPTPRYNRFGGAFDKYKRTDEPLQPFRRPLRQVQDAPFLDEPPAGNDRRGAVSRTGGTWAAKYAKKIIAWDVAPPREYFDELFRVSRNQIIWGGNYFDLPPTRCFVVYRKTNIPLKGFSMAPVEYAWTSFNRNACMIEAFAQGTAAEPRFHPTQKPVALYEELLERFAQPGDKILDTHVGSGSSLIACYNMGFDVWGYEIDAEYYRKASERLADHTAQIRMDLF